MVNGNTSVAVNVIRNAHIWKQNEPLNHWNARPSATSWRNYKWQVCKSDTFWKVKSGLWPALSKVARGLLGVPATSTSSERAFSLAWRTLEERRTQLSPHSVDGLFGTLCYYVLSYKMFIILMLFPLSHFWILFDIWRWFWGLAWEQSSAGTVGDGNDCCRDGACMGMKATGMGRGGDNVENNSGDGNLDCGQLWRDTTLCVIHTLCVVPCDATLPCVCRAVCGSIIRFLCCFYSSSPVVIYLQL